MVVGFIAGAAAPSVGSAAGVVVAGGAVDSFGVTAGSVLGVATGVVVGAGIDTGSAACGNAALRIGAYCSTIFSNSCASFGGGTSPFSSE